MGFCSPGFSPWCLSQWPASRVGAVLLGFLMLFDLMTGGYGAVFKNSSVILRPDTGWETEGVFFSPLERNWPPLF